MEDQETEDLDLSAGMVPHHPAGEITAFDHETGLPIVRRKTAQSEPKPEEKPAAKPEEKPEAKPETVEERSLPATPVVESKPQNTLHKPAGPAAKGTAVRLPDGTTGKLAFSDGVNARVRTDDGRNVNAKHKDITPMSEVPVKAHVRLIAARRNEQ